MTVKEHNVILRRAFNVNDSKHRGELLQESHEFTDGALLQLSNSRVTRQQTHILRVVRGSL